jgi:hypothetical protein
MDNLKNLDTELCVIYYSTLTTGQENIIVYEINLVEIDG